MSGLFLEVESPRLRREMSCAILATVLGRTVTLLGSCCKRAAPSLACASKPSRQALVPMMKMLSVRGDCHGFHRLGGLPWLHAKLNNLSTLLLRSAFQRFPESHWYVKLDYFCHNWLLQACEFHGATRSVPYFRYRIIGSPCLNLSKIAQLSWQTECLLAVEYGVPGIYGD
jgi:hypothetical protein